MARFLCWLRSFWQRTTMPVGMCVMRTADSVLFTCWPPAPPARMVSILMSDSASSSSASSSTSGVTSTEAKAVWRRAWLSKGLMRISRWTPVSAFKRPKAKEPVILSCTERMPASGSSVRSISTTSKPWRSAQRMYMRIRIEAQSQASTPPAPAEMAMKALVLSWGPPNMTRKSRAAMPFRMVCMARRASSRTSSSSSSVAISTSRSSSSIAPCTSSMGSTTPLAALRSPIIFCARSWSVQKSGRVSASAISLSRCC